MGGSAVLSYQQSIEWEPAAKCVTVRGLGTAVKILQRNTQQVYGISLIRRPHLRVIAVLVAVAVQAQARPVPRVVRVIPKMN